MTALLKALSFWLKQYRQISAMTQKQYHIPGVSSVRKKCKLLK